MALRKASRRSERSGLCEEQLDAIVRRARAREQPKGGTEPARCALRRALLRGLAGLTKRRHRVEISVPRGPLDVVCPHRGRRAARGKCLGAALVRADSPSRGSRLVHDTPHERMAEAEPPRHVRRPSQVERKQLVEHREQLDVRDLCCGRSQLRLERVTCNRGSVEPTPRRVGEKCQLFAERRGDGRRDVDAAEREVSAARPATLLTPACQLLEIKRVAAALLIQACEPCLLRRA